MICWMKPLFLEDGTPVEADLNNRPGRRAIRRRDWDKIDGNTFHEIKDSGESVYGSFRVRN